MADLPLDELRGKTVLEHYNIPNMDFMCHNRISGLTKTVPYGISP